MYSLLPDFGGKYKKGSGFSHLQVHDPTSSLQGRYLYGHN